MSSPPYRRLVPILGGTFDPIHHGHLRCALEIAAWIGEPVRLIPTHAPAHRGVPGATAAQRWAMLTAAAAGFTALAPDDRELRRSGPTWSVDTLEAMRKEEPDAAFAFILGADAFAGLDRWRSWERVRELTHFVLVPRPGHDVALSPVLAAWLAEHRARSLDDLRSAPAGCVIEARTTPLAISATAIRRLVSLGGDPAFLVPAAVRRFLRDHAVYQPADGQGEPEGTGSRA